MTRRSEAAVALCRPPVVRSSIGRGAGARRSQPCESLGVCTKLTVITSAADKTAAATTQVLGTTEALTLLLTVEGLLLAALTIAISLAGVRPTGGRPFIVRGGLALVITIAITLVAMGAAAAWATAYFNPGTSNVADLLEALGLAVGIVAGPVFAWCLWWAIRS